MKGGPPPARMSRPGVPGSEILIKKEVPVKDLIPNSIMYVALLTLDEILGENGLNAVLNYGDLKKYRGTFPPNNDKLEIHTGEFTQLNAAVIDIFGEKGARPLLYSSGRRGVQVILEKNPALFGFIHVGLKALSPAKRVEKVMATAVKETNKLFGENQKVTFLENGFMTEIFDCFWCRGLKTSVPICYAEIGFEAEAAKWASGGIEYDVKETTCVACGDKSCTFMATPK
jgi:predicted hydrocarbon binding protein